MTDKSATERLREMLDERGVAHSDHYLSTTWRDRHGILHLAGEPMADGSLVVDMLTPEQAIAATLGNMDKNRWHELFGTPERAASTLKNGTPLCGWCDKQTCEENGGECSLFYYNALLEWLRGDAE